MRPLNIGICVLCLVGSALATGSERPGWYFVTSLGWGGKSGMDQVGSNQDTFCYPTDACFQQTPVPSVTGYRWRYDIDLDSGIGLDLGVGRESNNWRYELTLSSTRHDSEQTFTGIEYLDGSPIRPGDGSVFADIEAGIDRVRTAVVALSALRTASFGAMTTYLGAGAGVAWVRVEGVLFRADYGSQTPTEFDPPLSSYDSIQHTDIAGGAVTFLLHAGADYPLNDRISLGARLTYSHVGDIEARGGYWRHPMHDLDNHFANENAFDTASGWQLSATVRYRLRR